jgi:O-antigen ligase/Flp pilus assembly protein TadD
LSAPSALERLTGKFENLGLGLLGLALPLVFYTPAEDAYRLPQLVMLSLASLCLCLSWRRAPQASLALVLGAAFFALRLLTQIHAGWRLDWLLEQGLYATLFLWGLAHLGEPGRAARLRAALLSGAALAAAYALLQYYGADPLAQGRLDQGFGARAQASLGNPDFWGGYLVLVLPLSLDVPLVQALLMVALVLSQTRAAWLGFAAGALVLALGGIRKPLARACAFGLVALALFAVPNPLNPRGLQSLQRLASSVDLGQSDAGGRFFMGRAAWRIAFNHPLSGVGGGNFCAAYVAEQGRMMAEPSGSQEPYRFTRDAHNDYLQIAAESGFPTLLCFVALLALAFRRAWLGRAWMRAALLASFAVNALLNFPLSIVPCAALLWLALAWACAEAAKEIRPGGAWIWRLAGAVLPLLAALCFMRQLQASALLNRGMNLSLAGREAEGDAPLRASAAIRPWDERPWMRLGLNADARSDAAQAEAAFSHCLWIPEGLANLSLVQAKQGRLDEAKVDCLEALKLNPRSVEALGNLGKIEYLKGDIPKAESLYLQGLAIQPSWAQGHFNLAAIYLNSGRSREAKPHLQQAVLLDPGNAQAALLLKGLK